MPVKVSQLQRLFSLLLMALLIVSPYPNLAAAYCTSSIGTIAVTPSSITSEIATGCTLLANSRLSFTCTNIPPLPTGEVRIHFVSGTVLDGGFIQITGPPAATAATKVPLIVLISNNSFGNGAAVLVTGSFPPSSNITVSFNTFISSKPCSLMLFLLYYDFVTVVTIADVVPIVLNQGAEVNVQYNNISTISASAWHSIPLAITFNANSFARVKDNTIKSHGDAGQGNTWILIFDDRGIYILGSQIASYFNYSGGGSWEFEDNWMQITTASSYSTVMCNAPMISAPQGGTFSFSRNYIKSVPLYGVNTLLGQTLGNAGTNFNYYFVGNTVDTFNGDHVVDTIGMTLTGNSRFEFSYNTFISNTNITGFYVDFYPISIRDTSQLTVSNNSFRTLVGASQSDALQFHRGFTLADSSTFTLSGNSIDAAVRTSPKKLFAMTSPTLSTSSHVTLCDTKYFGPRLSKFNYQISGDAGFLTLPIEYCRPTQSLSCITTNSMSQNLTLSNSKSASPSLSKSGTLSPSNSETLTGAGVFMPKKVYVPEKAVQNLATVTGALSVTAGAVAVPMAAAQQGVVLALLRMAQCEKDTLNGEPLDMPLHPLQFGLGGGSGRYGRGALLGNLLVIPALWCALLYLLLPFAIRALTGRTLDASRDFVGWPGMSVVPLTVLSEGSAMASVGLLTQGGAGDIVMGLIGLAILLVTTACWAAELRRMRHLVQLRRSSGVVGWAVVPFHPRFEWKVGNIDEEANDSYLDKRMQLVGSSWWLWSELAAQMLSIVVGVAEGLPVGHSLCRARWAVASLAAVLQAVVVMATTVPIELFLLGLIGTITSILVVLVALTTFDYGSPDSTFSALDAVGTANGILGMILIVTGTLAAAYESYRKRSKGEDEPSHSETLCNLKDLSTSDHLSEDIPPNGGTSLYTGLPSILDDADLRDAADGKYVAFEPFEL